MILAIHPISSLAIKLAPAHLTGDAAAPSGQRSAVTPVQGSYEQARLGETFVVDSTLRKESEKQYSLL